MTAGTPGFRFHEGVAPFGELEILTPHHQYTGDIIPNPVRVMSGSIACRAWAESDWIRSEIGDERADALMDDDFSPLKEHASRDAHDGFFLRDHCLAIAVKQLDPDDIDFTTKPLDLIPLSNLLGYGTGQLDVSGNFIQRFIKWKFMSDKVYGKVSNINVVPEFQGLKIGSALLYGVLDQLPSENKSTIYVARANRLLREKLKSLGYRTTGTQPRDNLVQDAVIAEVRMEAESVGMVREALIRRLPWLNDAERFEF